MSYLERVRMGRRSAGDGVMNATITVASLIGALFFAGLLGSFVLMHLVHGDSGVGLVVYGVLITWTLGFGICGLVIVAYRSWHAWQRREPPIWRGRGPWY